VITRPLEILLLCDFRKDSAATVRDHIESLERFSRHHIRRLSMLGDLPAGIELDRFDAIIVHYSLVACMDFYLTPKARGRIAAFRGLKALFIQDEYRFVDASIAAMRELGIHVLFTCVPDGEIGKVYSEEALPGVRKVPVLTGYVPSGLAERAAEPPSRRRVDVGYRGRNVPFWLGELGQEKWRIGRIFYADAKRYGLSCDISYREEDRLYGDHWYDFLARCKAVLGVESGASLFDFTGEIQRAVDAAVAKEPMIPYETVRDRYFRDLEGRIRLNQISPRCFEAAALRTVMVLYEGDYSGLLHPGRHYLPLKKDHSNMAEIVAALRDGERLDAIAEAAYRDIALDPANSFASFVGLCDGEIEARFDPAMAASGHPYGAAEFGRLASWNATAIRRRLYRRYSMLLNFLLLKVLLGWAGPERRGRLVKQLRMVYNLVTFYSWRKAQRDRAAVGRRST
jgi:hypothetical protein